MCVAIAKYFDDIGWVGVKNRDRNYIPEIEFERRKFNNIERLLMKDKMTDYTEGINSNGICILSTSLMVSDDEKEVKTRSKSKDGEKIRNALKLGNIKDAIKYLIETKMLGHTIIFNKDHMYLLESAKKDHVDFKYVLKSIPKNKTVAVTNHGIYLPWAGYQNNHDNKNETLSRLSSDSRLKIAQFVVKTAKNPHDMIDNLCKVYTENPQLNALRVDNGRKKMRTTAQIMLRPDEYTSYFRPIESNITFNFWDLNKPNSHTWVELLSNRTLWTNFKNVPSFKRLKHKNP